MKLVSQAITRKIGRSVLLAKKNSPKTLFVVGIVGVVTSAVLACKETLKLEATVNSFTDEIETVKELRNDCPVDSYSQTNYHRDLLHVYGKGLVNITKLYGPSVLLGAASVAALTASHVTLTNRNTGLTAAYAAVSSSFEAYRERVKEDLGEDKEAKIHNSLMLEKLPLDGKVQEYAAADPNKWSPYARFFDEGSPLWKKDPECNRILVQCQQNYLNHLLRARGHVFLNEAYDALGIERSQAGQVVGWVLSDHDRNGNRHIGDNYIDFGLFDPSAAKFIKGWERNVLLDFNVDGVIYDKI